jgi:hypothetical protein
MQKVAKAARSAANGPASKLGTAKIPDFGKWEPPATTAPKFVPPPPIPDEQQPNAKFVPAPPSPDGRQSSGKVVPLLAPDRLPADFDFGDRQSSGKVVPLPLGSDRWEKAMEDDKREDPGDLLVSVNIDGIKRVTVDKAGLVSLIELSTGEWAQRAVPPPLKAYLIPLLYPVLGFLFPWGGVRVLTWVGGGFVEPRR